jgi:hypothetical protein
MSGAPLAAESAGPALRAVRRAAARVARARRGGPPRGRRAWQATLPRVSPQAPALGAGARGGGLPRGIGSAARVVLALQARRSRGPGRGAGVAVGGELGRSARRPRVAGRCPGAGPAPLDPSSAPRIRPSGALGRGRRPTLRCAAGAGIAAAKAHGAPGVGRRRGATSERRGRLRPALEGRAPYRGSTRVARRRRGHLLGDRRGLRARPARGRCALRLAVGLGPGGISRWQPESRSRLTRSLKGGARFAPPIPGAARSFVLPASGVRRGSAAPFARTAGSWDGALFGTRSKLGPRTRSPQSARAASQSSPPGRGLVVVVGPRTHQACSEHDGSPKLAACAHPVWGRRVREGGLRGPSASSSDFPGDSTFPRGVPCSDSLSPCGAPRD